MGARRPASSHTFLAGSEYPLTVCVSAALARGITDQENAQRHNIQQHNLADGFELVGLGELADAVQSSQRLIQF
jgi:Uncharacterized conserved protein involved in intracellular sulfur reduction